MFLKSFIFAVVFTITIVGCGSNNSDTPPASTSATQEGSTTTDTNESLAVDRIETNTTVVPKSTLVFESNQLVKEVNITQNGEKRTFVVQVWGTNDQPFDGGNVRVAFPMTQIEKGVDVGSFTEYIVPCIKGRATFEYNAPANISGRSDSFVFGFYHDDPASVAPVQNVLFNMKPAGKQPVVTTYDMEVLPTNDKGTMELESIKEFTVKIVDKDGNEIGEKDGNFTITNLSPSIADLVDSNNNRIDALTINNTRRANFRVQSYKVSGTVPVKIQATFKDANGDNQSLEKVINQVILSGPPTAISISYASTAQDAEHAKFIEKIVVTATDKYFNRVNIHPAVSASLVVGYARDANTSNNTSNNKRRRLYFAPDESSTASLNKSDNTVKVNGGVDLSDVDVYNDILATFGTGYTYESSGKWDFNSSYVPTSSDVLGIIDDIGKNENTLGYAIGHNNREDMCRTGREWVGVVSYENNQTQLDENGMIVLDINYDYYLTGKDIVLAVNIIGNDANNSSVVRIGESVKLTLRGHGLEAPIVDIPANYSGPVYLDVWMKDTAEQYRNARFGYSVKASDNIDIKKAVAKYYVDANSTECNDKNGSGVAGVWVDINETQGKAGTIQLTNLIIGSEF